MQVSDKCNEWWIKRIDIFLTYQDVSRLSAVALVQGLKEAIKDVVSRSAVHTR